MAPKKDQAPEKIPLGRPGNNLKSGIVCEHNNNTNNNNHLLSSYIHEIVY
jgi:hypothetical protein